MGSIVVTDSWTASLIAFSRPTQMDPEYIRWLAGAWMRLIIA